MALYTTTTHLHTSETFLANSGLSAPINSEETLYYLVSITSTYVRTRVCELAFLHSPLSKNPTHFSSLYRSPSFRSFSPPSLSFSLSPFPLSVRHRTATVIFVVVSGAIFDAASRLSRIYLLSNYTQFDGANRRPRAVPGFFSGAREVICSNSGKIELYPSPKWMDGDVSSRSRSSVSTDVVV